MHGPVEMRPLCKWPLTTVHLSHFSPGSTSAALHLGSKIPQGLMPFIVLAMFIRATAATVDISDSAIVMRHFKTDVYRRKKKTDLLIYLASAGREKNEIIT